jgi:hypothetical protein
MTQFPERTHIEKNEKEEEKKKQEEGNSHEYKETEMNAMMIMISTQYLCVLT